LVFDKHLSNSKTLLHVQKKCGRNFSFPDQAKLKTTPAATPEKVALHFSKSFAEGNTQIVQEHTWIIKTII